MGNLLSFRKNLNNKILMVGLDNAGKTTILYILKDYGNFVSSTYFLPIDTLIMESKRIEIVAMDMSYSARYFKNALKEELFNTHALIYILDSNDKQNFSSAKFEFDHLRIDPLIKNKPILIFASKSDISSISEEEIISYFELEKIDDHEWHLQFCSAFTSEGIFEGLDWLMKKMQNI